MRIWIARACIVIAMGLGLWGVRDIIGIFAVDLAPAEAGMTQMLLTTGIVKLVVAVIIGTLAIKRG